MVSYTDLSPAKQPAAPVVVDLNDPVDEKQSPTKGRRNTRGGQQQQSAGDRQRTEDWLRNWSKLHSKVLYFKGVTEAALPELQQLFKACRGIRLNIDPHKTLDITGNVEFRSIHDAEKGFALLNNRQLETHKQTLAMSPLPNAELGAPPHGGYVYIKHIPDDATEATLYDFLRPSGPLYSCSIPTTAGGQPKTAAHACFVDASYAQTAIEQLNFAEYLGTNVMLQISRPPRPSHGKTHSDTPPTPTKKAPAGAPRPPPEPQSPPKPQSPPPQQQRTQSPIQNGRRTTSPTQAADGHRQGLGGVVVPGKLFVTNLHSTVSHKELFALFKKYGYIQSARVSIDAATKKSRGHGIVQFSDPGAALTAMKECQGADIKGRKITMYEYEHVTKSGSSSGMQDHDDQSPPVQQRQQSQQSQQTQKSEPGPNSVPFPRAAPASNAHSSDPLLDPAMLRSLSDSSRREILAQKLASAVASNPEVDVRDANDVVDSFLSRPLEDILALLSDPGLLASEWELEQQARVHLQRLQPSQPSQPVQTSSVDQDAAPPAPPVDASADTDGGSGAAPKASGGISVQDYNTDTEEYIEMLISQPESERKKKLGSKLFPLIKGMGYKDSTRLTVWILAHMSQDVRALAYTLSDPAKLRQIVNEAQEAIGGTHPA